MISINLNYLRTLSLVFDHSNEHIVKVIIFVSWRICLSLIAEYNLVFTEMFHYGRLYGFKLAIEGLRNVC